MSLESAAADLAVANNALTAAEQQLVDDLPLATVRKARITLAATIGVAVAAAQASCNARVVAAFVPWLP
ncbi:hypothetical protein [Variovorax paradoxus]|jgi:peptide deformylase|uniref:hypothetical protein n=1 Tax=Variovorax paradoxus TaxID=34073 RepID=UPI000B04CDA4